MRLRPSLILTILVAGAAASGTALAQTAECQRYRAELASLGRGGGIEGAAQRQRHEIARLTSYYQAIGCEGVQFLFFGSAPPAECPAIAQRINAMQAGYGRLAESDGSNLRRRRLTAAIKRACNPQREAEERRSRSTDDDASPRRLGGGRLVCVRACDGFFFPLHNLPAKGKSDADDMCKALCPGAETAAYSMPRGEDGDIAQAVSLRGKRYTKLAGAFKFQQSFDPSCSCRKEGQSWAEALQKAEKMIERGRGDIIVTAKKAEELSRPKLARKAKRSKQPEPQIAAKPLDVETTGSVAMSSSGTVAGSSSDMSDGGSDQLAADGEQPPEGPNTKRKVRIVGPTFIALPQPATEEPAEE